MAVEITDRIARALFRANENHIVRVRRRARGSHPVAGWGKIADGREVHCTLCDPLTVWYTNATGSQAQSDAEVAAGLHVLKHTDATLRIPLPVTFANDFQNKLGDDTGTSVVVATQAQVVLEVPPAAQRTLIAHAQHIVGVLGKQYAGSSLYSSADRALERFEGMGLIGTEAKA